MLAYDSEGLFFIGFIDEDRRRSGRRNRRSGVLDGGFNAVMSQDDLEEPGFRERLRAVDGFPTTQEH